MSAPAPAAKSPSAPAAPLSKGDKVGLVILLAVLSIILLVGGAKLGALWLVPCVLAVVLTAVWWTTTRKPMAERAFSVCSWVTSLFIALFAGKLILDAIAYDGDWYGVSETASAGARLFLGFVLIKFLVGMYEGLQRPAKEAIKPTLWLLAAYSLIGLIGLMGRADFPQNPEAVWALGKRVTGIGSRDLAGDVQTLINKGHVFLEKGDNERAEKVLREAVSRAKAQGSSRLDDAAYNWAISLSALGRYDEALSAYTLALGSNPGNSVKARSLHNRAGALYDLGRIPEAAAAAQEAADYLEALARGGSAVAKENLNGEPFVTAARHRAEAYAEEAKGT